MQAHETVGLRRTQQNIGETDQNSRADTGPEFPRGGVGAGDAGVEVIVDDGDDGRGGVRVIVEFYNLLMSDIRSNSSYAISAIEFNSKSLNPLDSLNPALIAKIKREAEAYANAAEKCQAIWSSLAKNDMAGANLTEKVL